ncbi:MAG: glycosyltransferase [Erysipelotrichaceae bacterium]|nr:glycosyltransferase [Erysipelotrichaceae bacterium]
MKTIVEINSNNYASTGNIVLNIAKEARKQGLKVYTCCRKSRTGLRFKYEDQIYIGTWLDRVISERLAVLFGLNGYFNVINTALFIRKLRSIKPDLIHLHSLCESYLNIRMLFSYFRKNNIPVIWTLHDNWAFTGRCAQFRCDKWLTGCGSCPHYDFFPKTLFFDNTAKVWKEREKIYNSLKTLTIVTPSKWLADLTRQSLFKENHPIEVINNGIDLEIFRPVDSGFREQYGLENKFIILGVAYFWDTCKGLDAFIELAKRLPEDCQIVMVGTNDEVDKLLPDNIISIHKTFNQKELVKIYSAADLFVNPTNDDNFPTVNMEALACGLPVLTYDTGGCAEIIDIHSGSKVPTEDLDAMGSEILRIKETRPYTRQACLTRAADFNMTDKYKEYVELYHKILNDRSV